jgi:hypothetical protein
MIEQHSFIRHKRVNHVLRRVGSRLSTIIPCALACCLAPI